MSFAVLVLGIHRSGSSLTAGVLHRLGINMGPRLLGPDAWNVRGHYEDIDFLHLNDQVIRDWRRPSPLLLDKQKEMYAKLVQSRAKESIFWGIKDPRFCFTAEYLIPLFNQEDVKWGFVVCDRDFEASVASLRKREGWRFFTRARDIQRRYLRARDRVLRSNPSVPCLHVPFEQMVADPTSEIATLLSWLNSWSGFFPTGPQRQSARSFVDPSLRHF
jgi:hypothetical protein